MEHLCGEEVSHISLLNSWEITHNGLTSYLEGAMENSPPLGG